MKTTQMLSVLWVAVFLAAQASAGQATKLTDSDGRTNIRRRAVTPVEVPPPENPVHARGCVGQIFYTDPAAFQSALGAAGKVQKEGENFEEAEDDLGPQVSLLFGDPLRHGSVRQRLHAWSFRCLLLRTQLHCVAAWNDARWQRCDA